MKGSSSAKSSGATSCVARCPGPMNPGATGGGITMRTIRRCGIIDRPSAGDRLRIEAGQRLGLLIEAVEHSQQLGQHEQVVEPLRHVEKLQRAAAVPSSGERVDERAESGAVDVSHVPEIEQKTVVAVLEDLSHRVGDL